MTEGNPVDQLILSGLDLWLKVGCTEEERAFAQRVEMDVTLHLPLSDAGWGDNLLATVDYAEACALLKKTLEPKTFKLAEAVAEQTADLLLTKYKLTSVTVLVKKRALPGLTYAAVQIQRS
ncbi:MAG: dihydroneopterin aldolase [Elusimicrobia bacterium]|nr:dihydroneopterin aldolase [Elusimicrobiota bacterium]